MALRLETRMSAQRSGSLSAIRVKSRKPEPCTSPAPGGEAPSAWAKAKAMAWGTWLTQPTSASWTAGSRSSTLAPRADQKAATRSTWSRGVPGVGDTMHAAPSKRSGVA